MKHVRGHGMDSQAGNVLSSESFTKANLRKSLKILVQPFKGQIWPDFEKFGLQVIYLSTQVF